MFDDQPIQSAGGQVPGNLPIGEPEDIFAGTEKDVEANLPVGDTTAVNSALGAGILRPVVASAPVQPVSPPMAQNAPVEPAPIRFNVMPEEIKEDYNPSLPKREEYAVKGPGATRWFLIFIIAIVFIGLIGVGGVWAYNKFFAPNLNFNQAQPASDQTQAGSVNNVDVLPPDQPGAVVETNQNNTAGSSTGTDISSTVTDNQVLFGQPIDTDGDGLDNETEKQIGTDPNNWDTDSDGLSDGDEVKIWKTNPLNPDTDGDGFSDGQEVKNGYNPNGPGKIFEPPVATTTP